MTSPPTPSAALAALAVAASLLPSLAHAQFSLGTPFSATVTLTAAPGSGRPTEVFARPGLTVDNFRELDIGVFAGESPLLDGSRIGFNWSPTATGGLLDIEYRMTSSLAQGINLQFVSAASTSVFSNWRRVSDNFADEQLAGFQNGWTVSQNPALLNGLTFNVLGMKTGQSYTVRAQYAFDYMPTAVPEPGTYALLLGGLGAVAFVARRRRAV